MAETILGEKQVKRVRTRTGLIVNDKTGEIVVTYDESLYVDNELVGTAAKQYSRDYPFWLASELGQIIAAMIDADLAQEDPAAPRAVS